MEDRKFVFGNPIKASAVKRAKSLFKRYARRFRFDPEYPKGLGWIPGDGPAGTFGIRQIVPLDANGETRETVKIGQGKPQAMPPSLSRDKDLVIGTIRMGYGHYRIALAIASAAKDAGMTPYWLDFLGFPESAASKAIASLEVLYARFSRLSQKSKLFNKYVWEKVTADIPQSLNYYPRDEELARLFTPLCERLPRGAAFAATHPWTARAAIHAGMENVVNVVPDNYPLCFHIIEGAKHAIQTTSSYFGYRSLRSMMPHGADVQPIPESDVCFTGHFVDHEIVSNIEIDCEKRLARVRDGRPKRILLTIGGSGAQLQRFVGIMEAFRSRLEEGRLTMFVNMGDHRGRYDELRAILDAMKIGYTVHDNWADTEAYAREVFEGHAKGLHLFLGHDVFTAVYATNILMRVSDIMITKPGELSFYPVPKLFIQRVGKHEAWGAIRGAEIGDGTLETGSNHGVIQTIGLFIEHNDLLNMYCRNIVRNKTAGVYDGAYNVIKMAKGLL